MEYDHKTLRHAGMKDIPYVIEFGKKIWYESPYARFTVDEKATREQIERFIIEGQEDYLVLLSHDEGKPVGTLVAYAFKPLFSSDKAAVEVCWWLEPEYRTSKRAIEMMDAYEYWAKLVGCKVVQYGLLTSSPQRMTKLYEKRGAKLAETVYHKEL